MRGGTERKDDFKMNLQVTDAKKNLASFREMMEHGNDITSSKKRDVTLQIKRRV